MLNKNVDQRIADADTLLQRLSGLGKVPEPSGPPTLAAPVELSSAFAENEQLLFSLVIAVEPKYDQLRAVTQVATYVRKDAVQRESLLSAVRMLSACADYLVDGSLAVTVPQTGSAQDQVVMAARAALLIGDRWPESIVAVTTGRGTVHGATAVGEVSDRAVQILQERTAEQLAARADSGVWLDELSVRLLDPRFTVIRREQCALLIGEEKEFDESQPLLGKPTPCVGREAVCRLTEFPSNLCALTSDNVPEKFIRCDRSHLDPRGRESRNDLAFRSDVYCSPRKERPA